MKVVGNKIIDAEASQSLKVIKIKETKDQNQRTKER